MSGKVDSTDDQTLHIKSAEPRLAAFGAKTKTRLAHAPAHHGTGPSTCLVPQGPRVQTLQRAGRLERGRPLHSGITALQPQRR